MNKLPSFAPIGRYLSAALLAAFILPVPHAKAVTAAECSGRYTADMVTVRDNDTGLTWQRTADTMTRTWDEANVYCNDNTPLLPGSGWRLPALFELQTIVDESVTAPSLDTSAKAFDPAGANGIYWTSEWHADFSSQAWTVDFGQLEPIGGAVRSNPKTGMLRVRCVR